MQINNFSGVNFVILGCFAVLAGCGGGTSDAPISETATLPPLNDMNSIESANLLAFAIDASTLETDIVEGVLDREGNRFQLGEVGGTIDARRETVALDDGGQVSIDDLAFEYVSTFASEPRASARTFGVIGLPTPIDELPNSSARYNGQANVTIQSNEVLYSLRGEAVIRVNFSDGIVSTELDNLNGQQTDALGDAVQITDFGSLTVSGSSLGGASFNGGEVQLTSELVADVSTRSEVSFEGGLFGPGAKEVGAVILVDDTAVSGTSVFADLLASQ